jgi:hypothetical protein
MSDTKNTISDLLTRLHVDVDNMNAFLLNLEKILESKSENVTISQTLEDGSTKEINVPSFGYLKSKINDVSTNFDTLISANNDVIGIKSANGDVRKFELKKISKLILELEKVAETSVEIPTSFGVKNNWFFESFLNPLLFVNIDVSSILTDDIDNFSVKRLIINTIDDDDLSFFNETYVGNNTIDLDEVRSTLEEQGIDYFEDDNIIPMEVPVNRFKGTFDILRIMEEELDQTITSTGETVTIFRRRYKLSSLNYTDVLEEAQNTRILAEGDMLITDNDSEYEVESVNKTDTEVVLKRIFGIEPIVIGADILRMKPVKYRAPELHVNVGYNEREVIFVRPISKAQNMTINEYSNGFGVFSNDLTIELEDESTSTLEQYYNNFVSDFGMILLGAAKEKKIPAIVAEEPSFPRIDVASFEVVQLDKHIKEDEDEQEILSQVAEKENLKVKVKENLKQIDDLKSQLNDTQKSKSEKNRIEQKIKSTIKKKATLQSQLSSTVRDLTTKLSVTPAFNRKPKYAVQGHWPMPEVKESKYGNQEVVQFKVRYRYLSKKGTAPNANQRKVAGGDEAYALFSPWTEFLTKPRSKELDEETGLYKWSTEDLASSEEVNANQLSIPIRKGENLEIQVKSMSEAGWPDNAVESTWSESVQVAFPEEIMSAEEATVISQRLFAEEARLDFEDELTSRGLDLHLSNQFTTGERFFAHQSKDIASGFFTSEGNIIDLFEKLQTQQTVIEGLQQALSQDKGIIKVTVIDGEGNISEVKNGDTLSLFAGYYKDQIKDTSGTSVVYNEGKVITKQYVISVENTSATLLELNALLMGGLEQEVDISNPGGNPESDYHVNRRYDLVPMSINAAVAGNKGSFLNAAGFQSSQVKSQFIHVRYLNYGLSNNLYDYYPVNGGAYLPATVNTDLVTYQGTNVSGSLVPISNGMYIPFHPGFNTLSGTNPSVWDGTTSPTEIINGNGYLSEFCMHILHPDIQNLGPSYDYATGNNWRDLVAGYDDTVGTAQDSLTISHSVYMETSANEVTGILGNKYNIQASNRSTSVALSSGVATNADFPIKMGFTPNDEFLIGKYTCGSYLYVFPNGYKEISVDGNHPLLSTRKIKIGSENSINIPVLFQYRCSDKLNRVGGYRANTKLKNIKYSKKIGIDVFIKDDIPFSFDIEVSTQYKKETTLDAPVVQSTGSVPVTF